jgi:hypothetical protein
VVEYKVVLKILLWLPFFGEVVWALVVECAMLSGWSGGEAESFSRLVDSIFNSGLGAILFSGICRF